MAELEEIRQRRAAAWERAQEVTRREEIQDFTWKSAGLFMDFHGFSGFDRKPKGFFFSPGSFSWIFGVWHGSTICTWVETLTRMEDSMRILLAKRQRIRSQRKGGQAKKNQEHSLVMKPPGLCSCCLVLLTQHSNGCNAYLITLLIWQCPFIFEFWTGNSTSRLAGLWKASRSLDSIFSLRVLFCKSNLYQCNHTWQFQILHARQQNPSKSSIWVKVKTHPGCVPYYAWRTFRFQLGHPRDGLQAQGQGSAAGNDAPAEAAVLKPCSWRPHFLEFWGAQL